VNYQQELDALIRSMTPSPLLENHVSWYQQNIALLNRRLNRLTKIKKALMNIEHPTPKQRRYLNRYKGKTLRIAAVIQHREYLMFIGQLRIRQSNGVHPTSASS
jgi:hypothetical protein